MHMKNPVYTLIALLLIIAAVQKSKAQCVADAGPDLALSCLNPTVTLVGSANVPGAAFVWSGPNNFISTVENPIVGFPGVFTLVITDPSNGCTASDQMIVTVSTPPPVLQAPAITQPSCGNADGAIDVTVTGGAPPYVFQWTQNGTTLPVFTEDLIGIPAGTYTLVVTDVNGCTASTFFSLISQNDVTLNGVVTQASCFGANSGAIDMTPSGGLPPYAYFWSNGSATQDIATLTAGAYTVTVTDNSGCIKTAGFTVGQPAQISIQKSVTNVLCFGGNTGAIDLTVSGGTPPYTYLWNHNSNTQDISNLSAGTYTVTVTDANGCTRVNTSVVTQGQATNLNFQTSNATCFGENNGAINLTVAGGIINATYDWSNDGPDNPDDDPQDLNFLVAGTYTVTVTMPNGCTVTGSQTITQPTQMLVSFNNLAADCGQSNGICSVIATGDVPPHTVDWVDIPGTNDPIFRPDVPAGAYEGIVTDGNGCTFSFISLVENKNGFLATTNTQNNTCVNGSSGAITITTSGGAAPFFMDWADIPGTDDPISRTDLPSGTYIGTITDNSGCSFLIAEAISAPAPFNFVVNSFPSCSDQVSGGISITVSGGEAPYFYTWNNGAADPNLFGLSPGDYTLTLTDASGCTAIQTVTVAEIPNTIELSVVVIDVSCNETDNGAINLTANGGNPPYAFQWSNGNTTEDLTGLTAGTYTVTVSDGNGCTKILAVTVGTEVPPTVTFLQVNPGCGATDGAIDLTISGNGPFFVNWLDIPGQSDPEDRTNLGAGTYFYVVSNANGCNTFGSVSINPFTLTANASSAACTGDSTASIDLSISGGNPPFTIDWTDRPGSPDPEDRSLLGPGYYTVQVSDALNCVASYTTYIDTLPGFNATFNVLQPSCGQNSGSISIFMSPPGFYTFDWAHIAGSSNQQNLNNLAGGEYTITITSGLGCRRIETFTLVQGGPITVTGNVANLLCQGSNSGIIDITVSGGSGQYFYNWSNGANSQDLFNTAAGTYTVTVTSSGNCTNTASFTVTQPALPLGIQSNQTLLTQITCFGNADGSISITPFGGTPPYTVNWIGPNGFTANGTAITGLAAGTYIVQITDVNGCSFSSQFTLVQPTPLTLANIIQCDFQVSIQAFGGVLPLAYGWDNGANGSTQNFQPGTYTVTITDANGCSTIQSVMVDPNPAPCTKISGIVVQDGNGNCIPEALEQGLGNWYLRASGPNGTFYGVTQMDGSYDMQVEPGNYVVNVLLPNGFSGTLCQNNLPVSLPTLGASSTADFALQNLPDCPLMFVDITNGPLRRCFSNNHFSLQCCNIGTATATDAYLDVQLPPFMTIQYASLPYQDLGGGLLRFALGNMAPFDCRFIQIITKISCDAVLGQTLCVEAHAYPEGDCFSNNAQWSGALLSVASRCEPDSLKFVLKNTGTASMTVPLDYIVIEDGIMGYQGMSAPLSVGDSMIVSLPANGSTWRIEAVQEPFTPQNAQPVLSVEGCSNTGSFTTGLFNQFPYPDGPLWIDIECDEVIGSYDPNDKQGLPLGYGPNGNILPGQYLEYKIRFQNTGTDTAFTVVIRDTLSQALDLTSVRPGASSHPYVYTVNGEGILIFDFPNIMLPDSNVNQEASQGFVEFQVSQRDSLPLGTVIQNTAAIYFDFNDPVITNTTRHTVNRNFVMIRAWAPGKPVYSVLVAPNPAQQYAEISIPEAPPGGDYQLLLYSLDGRLQQSIQENAPRFRLDGTQTADGIYVFKVLRNGEILGSGKLVIAR